MKEKPNKVLSEKEKKELENQIRKTKKFICNCTKSKCLKLYCDCLANGEYCLDCSCENCDNILENEEKIKVIKAKLKEEASLIINRSKMSGCTCSKSYCWKKYCECFKAGKACTSECRCINCNNTSVFQKEEENENKSTDKPIDIDFLRNKSVIIEKVDINYYDANFSMAETFYETIEDFFESKNALSSHPYNSNLYLKNENGRFNMILNKKILNNKIQEETKNGSNLKLETPFQNKKRRRIRTIKKIIHDYTANKSQSKTDTINRPKTIIPEIALENIQKMPKFE